MKLPFPPHKMIRILAKIPSSQQIVKTCLTCICSYTVITCRLNVGFPYFPVLTISSSASIYTSALQQTDINLRRQSLASYLLNAAFSLSWPLELNSWGENMCCTGFSTFALLLFAGCFSSSDALPRPTQEAVNDRPVIGKWSASKGIERRLCEKNIELKE